MKVYYNFLLQLGCYLLKCKIIHSWFLFKAKHLQQLVTDVFDCRITIIIIIIGLLGNIRDIKI